MKVVSVRHGFATNSSSSHSVVTGTPSWGGLTKQEIADYCDFSYAETEYGWAQETFSDMNDIVMYGLLNFIRLGYHVGYNEKFSESQFEFAVLSRCFSNELTTLLLKAGEKFCDGYIDHQSLFGNGTEEEFWEYVYSTVSVETDNDNH